MQKLLFISDESPFSFNHSGASSFKTNHLILLNQIEDFDIYLLCLPSYSKADINKFDPEIIYLLPNKISCIRADFTVARTLSFYKIVKRFFITKNSLISSSLLFPAVNGRNLSALQIIMDDLKPDIIWAEHLQPFLLVSYLKNFQGKTVYSHHDFLWKLILIRRQKLKDYLRAAFYKTIQKKLIRKSCKYVVGGATNELAEFQKINKNTSTLYLPTLYPIKSILFPQKSHLNKPLRIIHFGSSKATANRIGLKNLLLHIIPKLQDRIDFECWIIGEIDNNDLALRTLLNQPNIVCKGFVEDLDTVLHPLDLHILPYDQPTGCRTRYSVAVNFGQVLIAHQASVRGVTGLIHNQNCLIENSFDAISKSIIRLYRNPNERIRLGKNAKIWYNETHQVSANTEILKHWLSINNIMNV